MKVLIIEDEKKVIKFITEGLNQEGHESMFAEDGEVGLEMALSNEYDCIVLDWMMPKRDGISVLKELREKGNKTPVLMLTAKTGTQDKVSGLDAGADDYLAKPFHFEELTARLRSLTRRSEKSTLIKVGDLVLDTVIHKAKRGEREIELTVREYSLLEYLMRNAGRTLSRATIAQHVWSYSFYANSNLVDVYINRLRTKSEEDGNSRLIHSVRGVGYVMGEKVPGEED
ncbi:MAG: response regulator transcription factor [Chlorobiota bacterium]|nr:response regulator transcription factor [Chlorobiota bacterium]QQS67773.1 MAG: response regulator transcription factor [Chlorobiota bacterium]